MKNLIFKISIILNTSLLISSISLSQDLKSPIMVTKEKDNSLNLYFVCGDTLNIQKIDSISGAFVWGLIEKSDIADKIIANISLVSQLFGGHTIKMIHPRKTTDLIIHYKKSFP